MFTIHISQINEFFLIIDLIKKGASENEGTLELEVIFI